MPATLSTLEKILFLKQVHLFSGLTARDLHIVAQETEEVEFENGQAIFHEKDPGDSLYIVIRGNVAVTIGQGENRGIVAILGERECFGEMAVLTDQPRTATVEAASPVRVLRIGRDDFRNILLKHPHMAFGIFDVLIKRLRDTTRLYHHEMPHA